MRVEKIGDAMLYLGDCREILPTLSGVDCTVTSPPYNQMEGHRQSRPERAVGRQKRRLGFRELLERKGLHGRHGRA